MSEPSHSPSACAAVEPQQTAFSKAVRGAADIYSGVSALSWDTYWISAPHMPILRMRFAYLVTFACALILTAYFS